MGDTTDMYGRYVRQWGHCCWYWNVTLNGTKALTYTILILVNVALNNGWTDSHIAFGSLPKMLTFTKLFSRVKHSRVRLLAS